MARTDDRQQPSWTGTGAIVPDGETRPGLVDSLMIALVVVMANALFMLPVGLILPDTRQLCATYAISTCGAQTHGETVSAWLRFGLFVPWALLSVVVTRRRWRRAFVVVLIVQLLAVALIATTTIRTAG